MSVPCSFPVTRSGIVDTIAVANEIDAATSAAIYALRKAVGCVVSIHLNEFVWPLWLLLNELNLSPVHPNKC